MTNNLIFAISFGFKLKSNLNYNTSHKKTSSGNCSSGILLCQHVKLNVGFDQQGLLLYGTCYSQKKCFHHKVWCKADLSRDSP